MPERTALPALTAVGEDEPLFQGEFPPGGGAHTEPAGDLDGDGLTDVVVYDIDFSAAAVSLRALRRDDLFGARSTSRMDDIRQELPCRVAKQEP
ncbi:MAG: hypothetical protein M3O86_03790 [Actinomycetota bacterium]|nr:hypothetical protein [Actinomycetota bacterium]